MESRASFIIKDGECKSELEVGQSELNLKVSAKPITNIDLRLVTIITHRTKKRRKNDINLMIL